MILRKEDFAALDELFASETGRYFSVHEVRRIAATVLLEEELQHYGGSARITENALRRLARKNKVVFDSTRTLWLNVQRKLALVA